MALNDKLINYGNLATFQNNLINDSSTSDKATWSSEKIAEEIQQGGGGGVTNLMVNVTYSQLKNLRDSGLLVKGQKYRITDYVTTTSKVNTTSANHQFDIIVTAVDSSKLDENATAINHQFDSSTYYKWRYDITDEAWVLSNENSYTNLASGTCPLEGTPMYGLEYYSTVYPIEGVIGLDGEVPYTPQVSRKAIVSSSDNTLYLGDYIDEDKWNYWVEEGDVSGDYPEWFVGKYFIDTQDTFTRDGTYVEHNDYFNQAGGLYIWTDKDAETTILGADPIYIYTQESSYTNLVSGTCNISGEWYDVDYYTVGYPIEGVEYVDAEGSVYLNPYKVILYTEDDTLVFGDSPYQFLMDQYNEETEAGNPHQYTLEQIAWFEGKYFLDDGDSYKAAFYGVQPTVNAKLNSWELKYCLDNDVTRFDWAETGNSGTSLPAIKVRFFDGENLYDYIYIRYSEADGTGSIENFDYAWAYVENGDGKNLDDKTIDWNTIDTTDLVWSESLNLEYQDGVFMGSDYAMVMDYTENAGYVSEGKGVIYYMKDEFNNQCNYDFKNILKDTNQIVALYYGYGATPSYAIRVPEMDGTNPGSDYDYDDYQYAWKFLKFSGGDGATVTIPTGCFSEEEVDYQPLYALPSLETESEIVYFPIDTATQFDDFLWRGDDCDSTMCVLDTYIILNYYTFGGDQDDTLMGNSNNNIIISKIENNIMVLPNTTYPADTQYQQNLIEPLKGGQYVNITNNTINLDLPIAYQSQTGMMRPGDGLEVQNYSNGTIKIRTASTSVLGGVKVGDNLSINNGVLSLSTAISNAININTADDDDLLFRIRNLETPESKEYLTFEAATDNCSIYFKFETYSSGNEFKDIEVSIDGGLTWTTKTSSREGTLLATLNTGEKLYIRGENDRYFNTGWNRFDISEDCYVYGNIMSLVKKTNFDKIKTVPATCFWNLFLNNAHLLSHSSKVLFFPAIYLGNNAYSSMFEGCTSLETAPELVFNKFEGNACGSMFEGCTSLKYIKCVATENLAANYQKNNWVKNVAATGTFIKHKYATNWPTGNNGIPSGWTIQDE